MKKLLMIFAVILGGGALAGCNVPLFGGDSGGGGLTLDPTVPDPRFTAVFPAGDLALISTPALTVLAPRFDGDVAVQQSTDPGGADTSSGTGDSFTASPINLGTGTESEILKLTHASTDEAPWVITVTNFIPGEGGPISDGFLTPVADLTNPAVAIGTVYSFITVRAGVQNNDDPILAGVEGAAFRARVMANDWMAFGMWVYVPASGMAADFHGGAFAHVLDEWHADYEVTRSTGEAVYAGDAGGILLGAESQLSFFGDVRLTANWDDNTIRGNIGNIRNTQNNAGVGMTIHLEEAMLDMPSPGNYSGEISVSGGSYSDITGTWGGTFGGENSMDDTGGSHALGTFAGKDRSNGDVLVGTFLAECDYSTSCE